jgi:uncharacterized phage protein (TIGR02220 family)
MGIKRIVDTSFWTDGKVDEFSPEDKYFMLYLLTNPFSTQLGIYEISVKQVAFQLGYSVDSVNVLLDRFENKYGIIIYSKRTNEVAIKNFLRHSIIKGGKPVEDCIKKEMSKVKNKNLIREVFEFISEKDDLNETVKKIINEYEDDNENDNDNENDVSYHDSSTIREIVEYLNKKAGTDYKPTTKKTRDCIKARLNEKFTLENFKTVIDKKCAEWIGDEKMEKYLRPETLFGTKFEGYLNAKTTKVVANTGVPVGDNQTDLDDLF